MVKFFIPSVSYSDAITGSRKSKWIPRLFVLPLIAYIIFRCFETELTNFIIPFFPDEPDKSFGFYHDFLRLCFHEMLWLSFFLLTAWVLTVHVPISQVVSRMENHVLKKASLYTTGMVCLSLVTTFLIAYFTLHAFPNSADEYVYLYQAETLSQGKLTQQAHPLGDFFRFNHIAQKDGISVGRFPPGWPLLLSLPFFLAVPPLWLNPILGTISLLVFYNFVKRYYSPRVAIWSLATLAFTAYYLFNSASFFSHTSCLLFTVAFVYCLHRNHENPSGIYTFLAGVFLGMVVVTRYYTAVLIFLPVLVSLIYQHHWKAFKPLFFIGLGSLPFFILLCWYNLEITGDPLLPVTAWADRTETLGFVKGHSFMKGMEHFIRRFLLFLYWSSPSLLLLYFVFLYQKIRHKAQRYSVPEDYYMILLIIGYFFYHHLGGNQYGPRFLFEAYPFVIVFVINQAFKMKAKWPLALLVAGMVYAVVKLPYIMEREHRVVHERLDLYTQVRKAGVHNAVILISTNTGIIRPMPVRDLTRNGMDHSGEIIYAQDQGEKNTELMKFYANRSFYKYIRDPERVGGRLVRMRSTGY